MSYWNDPDSQLEEMARCGDPHVHAATKASDGPRRAVGTRVQETAYWKSGVAMAIRQWHWRKQWGQVAWLWP